MVYNVRIICAYVNKKVRRRSLYKNYIPLNSLSLKRGLFYD